MSTALKALYALAMSVAIVSAFTVHDLSAFQQPALARILFFHLPAAILGTLFLIAAAYFSARYLSTRSAHWDIRAEASFELGFALGMLALVTGIVFSKVQWGAWWNWDPRQTSFLMVMLMVGAYFAIRSGFSDPTKRANAAAAYALASVLPIIFLIFVYPRLPQVVSLHPDVVRQGSLDAQYKMVYWTMFALTGISCVWMYRLRVRAVLLERRLEQLDAELANRNRSGSLGVVRPISSPSERGQAR